MIRTKALARFISPAEKSAQGVAGQGWKVETAVRQSTFGNGRFASEFVGKSAVLAVKPAAPMARIESLASLPADRMITFASVDDLEKYVKMSEAEAGHSRGAVLSLFEHFIWSLDGKNACLNASTWSVNHADDIEGGLNVNFFIDAQGAVVGEAKVDINAGTEFHNNYRDFQQPEFYLKYCADHDFKDVRTAVIEAVDGL
mmetsp:Transcript_89411/g.178704  ORF Transcript_89411/g.178704 Transcript_89411/m.178704 type:complete len:200 (+) Transcript_89411:72-671(+)|eukprot:CAMPEP_0171624342 /NCGR_PEP_ID=MMETSP0990-20121206/18557_1 /TAXON_ID=483369 /ORGANISM="non described non described, Strain CCMP2098" /LENGTH=199 /DNA_ID=CAMNT_0012190863 /DNA_START=67 /DNA_END=666 /DNA_ORIENTATION=+